MQSAQKLAQLLEVIVCPACHGKLFLADDRVLCSACRRSYPIQDGIPVLLTQHARSDEHQ